MSEFVKLSVQCTDAHPSTTIAVANNLGGFFATAGLLAQAQGLAAGGRDMTVVCTPEAMDAFREKGNMAGIVEITSDSQLRR